MPAIISTASTNIDYVIYQRESTIVPANAKYRISIKGGANVAKAKRGAMYSEGTPEGVKTIITEEQLAALKNDKNFMRHVEKGFMVIVKDKEKVAKVVKSMESKDRSAPLVSTDDPRAPTKIKPELIEKNLA